GPLQLSVVAAGDPLDHLHKHICTLDNAGDYGPQPEWVSGQYPELFGIFWKCARVGERLSPYISICCVLMAVRFPLPWLQMTGIFTDGITGLDLLRWLNARVTWRDGVNMNDKESRYYSSRPVKSNE
ncbi:hypothetical protein N7492_010155, partial [Penicillium capsulatum]